MKHHSAFSLLELSIVLVIIGLIAGGIVAGASMIRAAELRAVITEHSQFNTAVNTFRDKYLGLPGDLRNAEAFWGSMTNCGAASPSATGTQTCNGDGNGALVKPVAASQTGESFMFWQHLANAELIVGTYSGIAGTVQEFDADIGVNVPASKLSGAGWSIENRDNTSGTLTASFQLNFGNGYIFGAETTSWGSQNYTRGRVLTPKEAWGIDKKIDDGKPAQGKLTIDDAFSVCTTATTNTSADFDAEYSLDSNDVACSLRFIKQF